MPRHFESAATPLDQPSSTTPFYRLGLTVHDMPDMPDNEFGSIESLAGRSKSFYDFNASCAFSETASSEIPKNRF